MATIGFFASICVCWVVSWADSYGAARGAHTGVRMALQRSRWEARTSVYRVHAHGVCVLLGAS